MSDDKRVRCHLSDLSPPKRRRSPGPKHVTLGCLSRAHRRTSLNGVSTAAQGRKEGRLDSRLYLSLINLSDGVEKCLHLINKQKGHCLRISTQVGRRPEETQGGARVVLQSESWFLKTGPEMLIFVKRF